MGDYGPVLSRIHDQQFGDLARAGAGELIARLHARGLMNGLVLDLGCGSGIAGRELVDAGYEVLGVDTSPAMLELARAAVPEASFIEQSAYEVDIPRCVGVLSLGEVLCYRPGPDRPGGIPLAAEALAIREPSGGDRAALGGLLRSIREGLDPSGVLLFDIAGPGRGGPAHREQVREGPDWTMWVRHARDDVLRSLTRQIVTFAADGDGTFVRNEETHLLRLLDPDRVEAALDESGFTWLRLPGYQDLDLGPGWHAWACSPTGEGRDRDPKASGPAFSAGPPDAVSEPQPHTGRLDPDTPRRGERFDLIAAWSNVHVEHIVSSAGADPGRQVQDHDEWVLLLDGEATVEVAGSPVALRSQDWLLIPAGTPHSVLRVNPGTRWLAVHVAAGAADRLNPRYRPPGA